MRNIYFYYFCFLAPLILLLYFWKSLDPNLALILLFSYVFVYRTWIDGYRLYSLGLISKNDIFKLFYNGDRIRFFKALYLQK
ncbi:hypothetical protein [Salinimicrobium oceani]|uniref:Uncharacterized protein n=1 Tax=Salinimicrobium oceani TaxID=2722702 RepID=A0ABX1D3P5_9FLAO|nr:hypothetical protein [Salinimicrobium oceani]NJW53844.1 hypothetical protein [Salinimicrobium oceani]